MGGSKGGGSSTTTNVPLTKQQYDPTGYAYREKLLPKLFDKYDTGLSDKEMSYYRGQGVEGVENTYGAGMKTLKENLARAGMGPGDGAYAESILDLVRQKLGARAGVDTDLTGKDIGMKQQNLQNLSNLIADSGTVGSGGSTQTVSGTGGSGVKSVLGGALSGGMGGLGLMGGLAKAGVLGANPSMWPWALGGAVLGGLGGLFD